MTIDINGMFEKISAVPIKDHYAVFGKRKTDAANIGELLRSCENDAMLCFCEREEKHRRGESADFEYFREYMRVLPTLKGTHSYDVACITLCKLCGASDISKKQFSDDEICSLWSKANDMCFGYDSEGAYAEKSYLSDKSDLDISGGGKCYYYAYENALICDYTELEFIRPDPYHSQLAKNKEKCGEKLQNDEISLLMSQNIYDILSKNNCQKIQIHLRSKNRYDNLTELIKYLKKQRLSANVLVAYETENDVNDIMELCLMSDEALRISTEIVITKGDSFNNLCHRLRALFAVYPAAQTRFGGCLTDNRFLLAEHHLFIKALLSVISEFENDEAEILRIAENILTAAHND